MLSRNIMKENNFQVEIQGNTLKFSDTALEQLLATPKDRIILEYGVFDKKLVPIISCVKEGSFWGSKLTNKKTISLKGSVRSNLESFGTKFILEYYDFPNVFKLIKYVHT